MLRQLAMWIERRRAVRRLWQDDAVKLIRSDERNAYYNAQRLAARARALGDRRLLWHWAKVAAEVARLSPHAEMDRNVVERIVTNELRNTSAHN